MDDFGILAKDFVFRTQGKSAPMSASKPTSSVNAGIGSLGSTSSSSMTGKSGWNSTPSGASLLGDNDALFGPSRNRNSPNYGFDDVFGGPPKYSNPSEGRSSASAFDSLLQGSKDSPKNSSLPVFDKPVYDDDIFHGVPGKKNSASVNYGDVFSSMASAAHDNASQYDDLLGNFEKVESEAKSYGSGLGSSEKPSGGTEKEVSGFDELIPGFGTSSPPLPRESSESNPLHQSAGPSTKPSSSMLDDPFVVLESTSSPAYPSSGLFTDPLEHISKPSDSTSRKTDGSSVGGGIFYNSDAFDGLTKSVPLFSSEMNKNEKNKSPLRAGRNLSPTHTTAGGPTEKSSLNNFENAMHKKVPVDDYRDSHQPLFDVPTGSDSHKSVGRSEFRQKDANANSYEANSQDVSPSDGNLETADDAWLTVSEIPLFTQSTSAPPPSRPPPPLDFKSKSSSKVDSSSSVGLNVKRKVNSTTSAKSMGVSSFDELEDFAMGKPQTSADGRADFFSSEEEIETNSTAAASAAAMKEAMDRAEAKFRQAREVRERENAVKNRDSAQQEEEKARKEAHEREYKERLDREQEEREREEKEGGQMRLEREREREREREIEREKARQAVERATKEARGRAAAEARIKAERTAAKKAHDEARERAERAAFQKAATEARERAAAGAREKAAAAATREQQHKNENDLESYFSMDARVNSAPRQRASMFGATSTGDFQEIEGETEERRRARLERNQRTHERAKKALAEKNERDFQTQREQAERHRIAETLDIEIKRWAAGKEGNLRALLSTMEYVLWPDCGWQPVPLTDIITAASVKKFYRKATLCIHPDKVQQKGANLQQKYIAEKVFDLLKEAWNKFNSEELF